MAVINRIGKVMKRNRALVTFDQGRIHRAIGRAAVSNGGFEQDYIREINDRIFAAGRTDDGIAQFLSDLVVVCLNGNPRYEVSNFPPTVEDIQDTVIHVLRSTGFTRTADAYECFRWGHHWVRQGAITDEQFVDNGYPPVDMEPLLDWNREHGCDTVAGLNGIVTRGEAKPLIDAAHARFEGTLDDAAARVLERHASQAGIRMIWISGPSSSGKTTTTVKLTDRLASHGLRFRMLNLDDYFWSLIEHPTDWINDRNYETPEAIDIQLLNQHLGALLDGETVDKPVYSFKEGRRVGSESVSLAVDEILLLDCLHGFYPPMTEGIDPAVVFRVYIEAMNPLYEEDAMKPLVDMAWSGRHLTRFEDVRLLRRTLRDTKHRNHPPLATLLHWHYVRAGELRAIIPLKGRADVVINGGMPFDLPALKPFFAGEESLWPEEIDLEQYASFLDARIRYRRISRLLDSVTGFRAEQVVDPGFIPGDSIVREFVGGSTVRIPHNE
jgi:uridine kinase